MKRLSSGILAFLATLMLTVPTDSEAFFGFFGGGFSFGFGSGWGWGGPGWGWGGPGYWYQPWRHSYWGYPYYRRFHRWYRPYGLYRNYGLFAPYAYPPALIAPTIVSPETPKEK